MFDQRAWDLVLKLKLLLAVLLNQMLDKKASNTLRKRRMDMLCEHRWGTLFQEVELKLRSALPSFIQKSPHIGETGSSSPTSVATADFTDTESQSSADDISSMLLADNTFSSVISESQGRRAESKIRDGELRKATQILTSPTTFATPCVDTFLQLSSKQPARLPQNKITPEMLSFEPAPEAGITVTTETVWQAIKSAPKGSSSGIDGLRFDHLYYIGEGGNHPMIKALTALTNLALQGELPQWYYTFIASADLIALAKSDGGIRPIAMGSIWRKLFGKSALIYLSVDIRTYFELYQYGVGSKSGCEVVNHRARMLLKQNKNHVLFKTDYSNAFNSMFRVAILQAVKEHFPGLFPFVSAVYAPCSDLWTACDESGERTTISSEEGVQQGDVLEQEAEHRGRRRGAGRDGRPHHGAEP
jgi:hypothetical protein